jgi:hypothetical protein
MHEHADEYSSKLAQFGVADEVVASAGEVGEVGEIEGLDKLRWQPRFLWLLFLIGATVVCDAVTTSVTTAILVDEYSVTVSTTSAYDVEVSYWVDEVVLSVTIM